MTPGLGFAFLAMLCFGASDLLYKRMAQAGIETRQLMMVQAWTFCPTVTLYAYATGNLHVSRAAIWGALAGLFALIGFYNFAKSLRSGSVSAIAPIFRLNFTITAALAILLLGEPLTVTKFAGLTLALVAVGLLLIDPHKLQRSEGSGPLVRVLVATAALGVGNLFYKVGLRNGATPETLISAQAWVFCSLATLQAVAVEGRPRPSWTIWRYAVPSALLQVTAFVALLHGLAVGPTSVLIPIAQLGFIITALVGVVAFGETLSRGKQAGFVIAAAALVLLAMS
jgi:uncharacterized membrane protein